MALSIVGQRSLLIVIPIFNDWEAVHRLLDQADAVLAGMQMKATLLLVDDASTESPDHRKFKRPFVSLNELHLLSLRRNLGHQRAIAVGLAFGHEHLPADMVMVMDGDGQDSPQDFAKLLTKLDSLGGKPIVFAERKRRSEGLIFRFFYWVFRILHRLLTGHAARVGNFSLIPREQLRRLMVISEIWNNYAAAVYKARLPMATVPTGRFKRIAGETRMNFSSLVSHGLSAMSIFNDTIGVRTLAIGIVLTLLSAAGLAAVVAYHFARHAHGLDVLFLPLVISLTGLIVICAVLATFVLNSQAHRTTSTFLPMRDYKFYYDTSQRLDV